MCVCTDWWKIRNCGNEWDDWWWWRMQHPPASPVLRLLKLTDPNFSPKCCCLSNKLWDVTSHTTILILNHRQNVVSYILHKGPGSQGLMHWCSVQQIVCSSPAHCPSSDKVKTLRMVCVSGLHHCSHCTVNYSSHFLTIFCARQSETKIVLRCTSQKTT
jgi:hypothetical protein